MSLQSNFDLVTLFGSLRLVQLSSTKQLATSGSNGRISSPQARGTGTRLLVPSERSWRCRPNVGALWITES